MDVTQLALNSPFAVIGILIVFYLIIKEFSPLFRRGRMDEEKKNAEQINNSLLTAVNELASSLKLLSAEIQKQSAITDIKLDLVLHEVRESKK